AATSPINLKGTQTYTYNVKNAGPDDATNVELTIPIPSALPTLFDVVSVNINGSPAGGACSGPPSIVCTLGTIINGTTTVITITGTSDIPTNSKQQTFSQTPTVTANPLSIVDGNGANNSATIPNLVQRQS